MIDFRLIFEQTPARVLVLAPEPSYRILAASDAYFEETMTTRDIVSRPMFDVFPDNPNDLHANGVRHLSASFERVFAGRASDVMPVQRYDIRDRSGTFIERHWSPVNAPLTATDGSFVALAHRVEDVTPFVQQAESILGETALLKHEILARGLELARANQTLREQAEQQKRILAIVSHDLTSPLSSMRVGLGVLAQHFREHGAVPPRILGTLASSTARMTELLDDLTDYTTIRLQGLLPVRRARVNLRGLCEEVVQAAQVANPDRSIGLLAGESITAHADPKRMRQVISNLINNALTYGDQDRPVRVSVRPVTGACVVTVSNKGIPIPEDLIPRLFQPFLRGPAGRTAQQRGHMGLGLYIVHQIVRAHEGAIDVKSTRQGTHFSVYLPNP